MEDNLQVDGDLIQCLLTRGNVMDTENLNMGNILFRNKVVKVCEMSVQENKD